MSEGWSEKAVELAAAEIARSVGDLPSRWRIYVTAAKHALTAAPAVPAKET